MRNARTITVTGPLLLASLIALSGCIGDDDAEPPAPKVTLAEMCTQASMQRIMPAGATVKDIPNALTYLPAEMRSTMGGVVVVTENALGDGAPAYCVVTGSFVTNNESGKTANFGAVFPAPGKWNGKYLQFGCGGNCGSVFEAGPPTVAHISSGYAMWHTDDGHVDRSIAEKGFSVEADPTFAVKAPGVPDTDALDDYLYRAVHSLSALGKQATAALYGAAKVDRSYFLGCSDGGREAMVEATHYPDDFDGIVAGAPYDPPAAHTNWMTRQLVQFRSPAAALSDAQVKLVATAAASCDTSDGVTDGLDQNPNACEFNVRTAVPLCAAGSTSDSCLTQAQMESVSAIVSAVRDPSGITVAAGWASATFTSNESFFYEFPSAPLTLTGPDPFGPEPYLSMFTEWAFSNYILRDFVYAGASDYNGTQSLGMTFGLGDPADASSFQATMPTTTVQRITSAFQKGLWSDPAALSNFSSRGGKLIMYHGLTDALMNANTTIRYYRALAAARGGYGNLQNDVRLFLAPGMNHCIGGDGPNAFLNQYNAKGWFAGPQVPFDTDHDALAALENWVEKGTPPKSIIASKYADDDASKSVQRTMPLCPFPSKARYNGSGAINDAANWACPESDTSMLNIGSAGVRAGM